MEKPHLPPWTQMPRRPIGAWLTPERLWSSGRLWLGKHRPRHTGAGAVTTPSPTVSCHLPHCLVRPGGWSQCFGAQRSTTRCGAALPGAGLEPGAVRGAGELGGLAGQLSSLCLCEFISVYGISQCRLRVN